MNAEIWTCWLHEPARTGVTYRRYGAVYPWPLNMLLPMQKRKQVKQQLSLAGWANKTVEQVNHDELRRQRQQQQHNYMVVVICRLLVMLTTLVVHCP